MSSSCNNELQSTLLGATVCVDKPKYCSLDSEAEEAGIKKGAQSLCIELFSLNSDTANNLRLSMDEINDFLLTTSEDSSDNLSEKQTDMACVLTVGRNKSCTLQIQDARASSVQFDIRGTMNTEGIVLCELLDRSTNGTFVNSVRVGTGKTMALRSGDEITILAEEQVGNQAISFVYRNTTETSNTSNIKCHPRKEGTLDINSAKEFICTVEDEVTCTVCSELYHNCIAVMPCFHMFCAGCFSDWLTHSPSCPICRETVTEAYRNRGMDNVVSSVENGYPDRARTSNDKRMLDKKDRISAHGRVAIRQKKIHKTAPTYDGSTEQQDAFISVIIPLNRSVIRRNQERVDPTQRIAQAQALADAYEPYNNNQTELRTNTEGADGQRRSRRGRMADNAGSSMCTIM